MKNINTSLLAFFIIICTVIAIWDSIWKVIAMWKSARHEQVAWYICLAIFNTAGILPILYILLYQRKDAEPPTIKN